MQEKTLTKADLDAVRDIAGFPLGADEDIIALSDPPFYTACPNPFIADFIREHGKVYDEAADDYHREPYAADVSEGKADPVYNAHSYHTKVPPKAIMRYILHYTDPGDIVFDGFCGSGMTGVAAQSKDRKIILADLSPMATFLANQYNRSSNIDLPAAEKIIEDAIKNCGWMYKTFHTVDDKIQKDAFGEPIIGILHCVIWSDVLICPHCSEEFILWDAALDYENKKVKEIFACPKCGSNLKKSDCAHSQENYFDDLLGKVHSTSKQVPVLIKYKVGKKFFQRKPIKEDFDLIEKIQNTPIKNWIPNDRMPEGEESRRNDRYGMTNVHHFYTRRNLITLGCLYSAIWVPTDELPPGYNTAQPIHSHNLTNVHHFYTRRNLITLGYLYPALKLNRIKMEFTSTLNRCNRLNRFLVKNFFHGGGGWIGGNLSGTLYMPSFSVEVNALSTFRKKIDKYVSWNYGGENSVISCQSSTDLKNIPDKSIDYIFTDPPFGANLNYSELSFIWESWLKVKTNNRCEAIINDVQEKGLREYQNLMLSCFKEFYRILKPNRWITVEFHNSKNAVWSAIQEALMLSGFVVADVRTLDKQQGSFKQVTSSNAVKQDLVISAYKPKEKLAEKFLSGEVSEETAWAFVRQHLENLPVTVKSGGKLDLISERRAFLLFDRMVAYHIVNGLSVPMDAGDFYRGLDERFSKRDEMYFLPSQASEYDISRSKMELARAESSLFVVDEKSAINWIYSQLNPSAGGSPQTYQSLQPKFMQELKSLKKNEKLPELLTMLEENFLKDEAGNWYIPDLTKSGDIAKLREKNLLKEFRDYLTTRGKLNNFRSEAVKVGFKKLWEDGDYKTIVEFSARLPEEIFHENQDLMMFRDLSRDRL